MFSFFKSKQKNPQVVVRTVTERVVNPINEETDRRIKSTIERTTNEYLRLSELVDKSLKRRESGEDPNSPWARWNEAENHRHLGQMMVLSDMIALIQGRDVIIVGVELEKKARETRGTIVHPMNTYIGPSSPQWAPVTK